MSKNFGNLLQQARQMREKLAQLRKELDSREFKINANGMSILINGKQQILGITLNDDYLDLDKSTLEDVIKVAVNKAVEESLNNVNSAISKLTGDVDISGLF